MRLRDFFTMIFLLVMLIFSLYLLWLNVPTEEVEFQAYKAQISEGLPLESLQFEHNMRFAEKNIKYGLSEMCSEVKKQNFREAVKILEEQTILEFRESVVGDADIKVSCSNISPEPNQKGHFVAGEGGPSLFLNTLRYAVILEGKISLYREETCETPNIALHELLHALGFDHNSNEESIMFPVTNCRQRIDAQIVRDINRIYSEPSLADLNVEKIEANQFGRYLNFEIIVANDGLKRADFVSLNIVIDDRIIKEFELGEVEIGAKRFLTVSNLRVPGKFEEIVFVVKSPEEEISKENNVVTIKPSE